MKREKLGSRLGFILLSAGCAIGIGNVWKFPYMAGQNGGAIFVLLYFVFLLILGIPVMTMEFAMGRAAQKSPVKMYQKLEPKGSKWHLHSFPALAGNYLLLMFYTSVAGWILQYFIFAAQGKFNGTTSAEISELYANMLADPVTMTISVVIILLIAVVACLFGLQKGIERITKWMMLALLAIIIVLVINSLTLPKAAEGLSFYLIPNLDSVKEVKGGWFGVIVAAMSQAFFTLSIGMGSMAIFGSYLNKDRRLLGEAINIAVLDTFVAICSGLIIFPAFFTYRTSPDAMPNAGPPLIFETLPSIFANMELGALWGSLFFIFLTFASLTTVLAVFENIVACCMDLGLSRKKACLINGAVLIVLSLPCIFGFNLLSGFHPLGGDSTILDFEDFLVSYILLPAGSLIYVLFCTSRYGWGFKKFQKEANIGKGLKIADWMRVYMTYILPIAIAVLFIVGIVQKLPIF